MNMMEECLKCVKQHSPEMSIKEHLYIIIMPAEYSETTSAHLLQLALTGQIVSTSLSATG